MRAAGSCGQACSRARSRLESRATGRPSAIPGRVRLPTRPLAEGCETSAISGHCPAAAEVIGESTDCSGVQMLQCIGHNRRLCLSGICGLASLSPPMRTPNSACLYFLPPDDIRLSGGRRILHHYFLHKQRAAVLKALLLVKGNQPINVVNVPWYLEV
jgi:hypothetical protein